jgi:beta-lactamase superfamily II metal-dependent hydrolase
MYRIEMLPAGHGDGLLITYGDEAMPHYVLIDGGPFYAYRNARLEEQPTLSKRIRRVVDEGGSLELMVVTHIDADHIESPVRLLGSRPPDLAIGDIWFNAWKHLRPQATDRLGPLQGEMLSALIGQQRLPWNAAIGGGAVATTDDEPLAQITLPGGMRLTLLSPTVHALAALSCEWKRELAKAGLDPDSPDKALERLKTSRLKPDDYLGAPAVDVARLAEEPFEGDSGLANGSSIAFVAEYEGKRCLFAGDAHAPTLRRSINRLLVGSGATRLRLDAFKIPHHGSKNNLNAELLDLIECPRYLVSTNGSIFGHPDRAAIARIIVQGGDPVLCFNYRSKENAVWDDAALQEQYRYQTRYGDEMLGGLIIDL